MGTSQRTSASTAILVDKATAPLIKDHDIVMEGRAQFLTLQSPDNGSFTIINIYAQRSSNDRALLWRKLSQADFTADHFIIGGDFNHLEDTDRGGTSGERQMHRREAASWHHMMLQYGLVDAWRLDNFRKMLSKEYTFDNGRAGPRFAVSRIDKFMISQDIEVRGGRIETTASVKKLSDHSPLVITVWGNHLPLGNPPRFFDASLLSEETCKKEMLLVWDGDHSRRTNDQDWLAWLEAAIGHVMHCNTRLARDKKHAQRTRIRTYAKKVQLAKIQLQSDRTNVEVRDILSNAQSKLAEVFQDSVARNQHLSLAKWLRYGNTCSKPFFDFHRIGKKKALLKELETESRTVTGQSDLTDYITDYYKCLYASKASTSGTKEA